MTDTAHAVVTLAGPMTIRQADDVATTLMDALTQSSAIELDFSGVSSVDLTFIQLLVAAAKSAEADGKTLTLQAPAPACLVQACELVGIQPGRWTNHLFQGRAS